MNTIKSQTGHPDKCASSRRLAYYFYLIFVTTALAASLILIADSANAQSADTAPPVERAASSVAPAAPHRYSAADIERAFNFMDANKDGKISLEEAAGFRNVARHFDAADTNKDNALSLEEFGNALNKP